MNLPNAHAAVVDRRKVTDYLLAFDHPEGAEKAEFFARRGFTADDFELLADALITHAQTHSVAATSASKHGGKYVIEGEMLCPDGRRPVVRAVWIIDTGDDVPRLVTAYPL